MATVLKHSEQADKTPAAREVSGLAGFNLSDLAEEGRSRLAECRSLIEKMLADARIEAEKIKSEADAKGYQEGLLRAAVDADQKLQVAAQERASQSLQSMQNAMKQMYQSYEQWMQQYAESLNAIALAAAEKIIGQRLEREPQLLVQWADEALRRARSATQLTLAVHPETLAVLGQSLDELIASPDLPEKTHVEPDESLQRNDVVVRQVGGEIRAGLTDQLERLAELLS
jgi:flagellar assembly protein FliH